MPVRGAVDVPDGGLEQAASAAKHSGHGQVSPLHPGNQVLVEQPYHKAAVDDA
jgi:hypothetical protein